MRLLGRAEQVRRGVEPVCRARPGAAERVTDGPGDDRRRDAEVGQGRRDPDLVRQRPCPVADGVGGPRVGAARAVEPERVDDGPDPVTAGLRAGAPRAAAARP